MTEPKKDDPIRVTYRPGVGDPKSTTAFGGLTFRAGKEVELPGHFARKARGNPHFKVAGEETYGDNLPETAQSDPQPEASFEDNQRAAHIEEYGTDDPEKVDALRRAREHEFEQRAAKASPDRDPEPHEADDDEDDEVEGDAFDEMTVPQLRAYAEDHNIDLGDAKGKDAVLAAVKKAKK